MSTKRKPARATAKARLLAYVGGDGSCDYMGEDGRRHTRKCRRLLAAVLREAADAAVTVMYHATSDAYDAGKVGRTAWMVRHNENLRAAVLSSGSRCKGGRK